ncbi:helix-turn-helix transcriptional regulator [Maricaulis sp.]|uniref:helix-turn-helix domain-containing protein n=1 Tax=Maricaulis sp. TaxID=1486257 RepID=UPI000C4FA80D|nr:helix-turn-helix transcriptional regulator [Maricaulis sp.]MAC90811.1 transcriptional regulator [Maricaulis sp.]
MGLKSLRLDKGWSQEQLATISGLSQRTIQRAERGETPSLETLRALAASFDLSPARLRDLIDPQTETTDMPANDTTPLPAAETDPSTATPLLSPVWKRILLAAGLYLVVMSWLALMQVFAGWAPELLGFVGLVGAGGIATVAFAALGGADETADPSDDKPG